MYNSLDNYIEFSYYNLIAAYLSRQQFNTYKIRTYFKTINIRLKYILKL